MRAVKYWLWVGVFMVLIQVMIGGITRLTGSGLSITEWDVIMGALPPLNETAWQAAFQKYQQFPQYELVNSDMNLEGFKSIFWWEYIHRNWARLIGLVFLFPFLWFWVRGRLSKPLILQLSVIFVLGALQGVMGWVMVASGLIDQPWVSPYNLTMHLILALAVYMYLIWLVLSLRRKPIQTDHPVARKNIRVVFALLMLQIVFGGFMAGTKAALLYNTWPLMQGEWLPAAAFKGSNLAVVLFENTASIQFIHRTLGILVWLALVWYWMQNRQFSAPLLRRLEHVLLATGTLQVVLGIATLLLADRSIPVFWGVVHQVTAFILAGITVAIWYYSGRRPATL